MRKDGQGIRNLSLAVVSCIILQACGQQSQYDSNYIANETSGVKSSSLQSQGSGINSILNQSQTDQWNSDVYDSIQQNDYDSGSYETEDAYEQNEPDNVQDIGTDESAITEEMLVYSADIDMETIHYDEDKQSLTDLIKSNGGFISSSNESNDDYYWYRNDNNKRASKYWSVEFRVPSDKYQTIIESVGTIGNVKRCNQNVQNIQTEYHDVELQLEQLKIQEEQLEKLADQADDIEYLYQIMNKLSETRIQIDKLNTQKNSYETDVKYSYITISLREVNEYSESGQLVPEKELTFIEEIVKNFAEANENLVDDVKDIILTIVYNIYKIIILIAVIQLALYGRKKSVSKKKELETKNKQGSQNKQDDKNTPVDVIINDDKHLEDKQ